MKPYLTILFAVFLAIPASAQNAGRDLTSASLEELMSMPVTSVSRKTQSLSKTGAAIYVIDREQIRRSGATNIPDLLRLAPGVQVAQITSNTWAIGIRGFDHRYQAKVLVLIDGRTVYSPNFSGVYWDGQSVPVQNIDRIEVIRGPGGTMWGSNAMNGVINIITKNAADTRGGLIAAGAGSHDRAQSLLQYGGAAGKAGNYRIYGRYSDTGNGAGIDSAIAADAFHSIQTGFRADLDLGPRDSLTTQGDLFGASEDQTVITVVSDRLPGMVTFHDKVRLASGNVLTRWKHAFANGSETTAQFYFDHVRRLDQGLDRLNTGDFDLQYHFHAGPRHDIVTGFGYRVTDHVNSDGYSTFFGDGHKREHLFNTYIQDEIALTRALALTLGAKLEHNSYTGFEYEPSTQLVWTPTPRHSLWASAAKAIQQPSWFYAAARQDAASFPTEGGGFAVFQLLGSPQSRATRLYNFEIGYRSELSKRLTFDVSIFHSEYRRLQTLEPDDPYFTFTAGPPHLVLPNTWANFGKAQSNGAELSAKWNITRWWRLSPGLTFLNMSLSQDARSRDTTFADIPGDSPARQAQLRSGISLPHHLEWDAAAYYTSRLATGPVPAYLRIDSRLGWRYGESLEFSLNGQNLSHPAHTEFLDGLQVQPTQAKRSIFASFTWRL